jgi:hypothetical protein
MNKIINNLMNPIVKNVLILLLDNQNLFSTGICDWVESLEKNNLITENESILFFDYMKNNIPNSRNYFCGFWWKMGKIEPRIEWIFAQLNKNVLDEKNI